MLADNTQSIGVWVSFVRLNLYSASPPALDSPSSTDPPLGCFLRVHAGGSNAVFNPFMMSTLRTDALFVPFQVNYNASGAGTALNTVYSFFPNGGLFLGGLRGYRIPRDLKIDFMDETGAALRCLSSAVRLDFRPISKTGNFEANGERY